MNRLNQIKQKFQQISDREPAFFQSPGRVNLIGDHTDYNMGLALPAAIDRYVQMGIQFNKTDTCYVYALDTGQTHSFGLSDAKTIKNGHFDQNKLSKSLINICAIKLSQSTQN